MTGLRTMIQFFSRAMPMRVLVMLAAVLASSVAVAQSGEGDDAKPAGNDWVEQTVQTCAACHGKQGVAQTANFPILAGQYQDYLLHSLKAYRSGDRQNGIMAGQVQGMTDAQLKALSVYFSKQTVGPLHTPHVD